jgi:hypothetical protein
LPFFKNEEWLISAPINFFIDGLLYKNYFITQQPLELEPKSKKNPADLNCRVLLYPFNRIEGKGRGETGGRTYGET